MSLKIALCLSGHARTYFFTKQFWDEHVFSKYSVDVFMHLWDTVGPRSFGTDRTEHSPEPRRDYESGIINSPQLNVDDVKSIWNPVKIVVEDYDSLHDMFCTSITPILNERDRRGIPAGFEHHHPLSVRSMLYKRYKCNELKTSHALDNNIKYDLVIQSRPDVAITHPILDKIFNSNDLYFHNCRSVTPDPEINDFGCMGASNDVDVWCDLYNKVDGLFDVLKTDANFFKFLNPHKMYVQYLMSQNKTYKELDIGLSIVRDTGIVLGWPYSQNIIKQRMY